MRTCDKDLTMDKCTKFVILAVVVMAVYISQQSVSALPSAMLCSGQCKHGGEMVMPTSIFGYCYCKCKKHFTGPRCEFRKKRRFRQKYALRKIRRKYKKLLRKMRLAKESG